MFICYLFQDDEEALKNPADDKRILKEPDGMIDKNKPEDEEKDDKDDDWLGEDEEEGGKKEQPKGRRLG